METLEAPRRGRQAEAARNDERILEAARAVFLADPEAPIAAVAKQAGVGIAALYRRYRSKDDLLLRLALDGLRRYVEVAEAALAAGDEADADPWQTFAGFMRAALDAGAGALSVRFAGSFTPSAELRRAGQRAFALTQALIDRAKRAGALRADIELGDVSLLFELLQAVRVDGDQRTRQLRQRYLALLLDALRAPAAAPLPGPPPTGPEIAARYGD